MSNSLSGVQFLETTEIWRRISTYCNWRSFTSGLWSPISRQPSTISGWTRTGDDHVVAAGDDQRVRADVRTCFKGLKPLTLVARCRVDSYLHIRVFTRLKFSMPRFFNWYQLKRPIWTNREEEDGLIKKIVRFNSSPLRVEAETHVGIFFSMCFSAAAAIQSNPRS